MPHLYPPKVTNSIDLNALQRLNRGNRMQSVITQEQVRQITNGRTPLVPVEYEEARRAIAACVTLDETKYWSDKADALAAWAKIYRDDGIVRQAAILKERAYTRMGELARELRPIQVKPGGGRLPGPKSLLVRSGLNLSQADAALFLAKMTPAKRAELEALPRPPSPLQARRVITGNASVWYPVGSALRTAAVQLKKVSPVAAARDVRKENVHTARSLATEMIEWLDSFESALPKPPRAEDGTLS